MMISEQIPAAWQPYLADVLTDPALLNLEYFLTQQQTRGAVLLPPPAQRFNALRATAPEQVRVLILGQDPYPTAGHAHGLAFSVQADVQPLPRSLRNIYRELQDDLGIEPAAHGCLQSWAEQGVLLLNTVLSVEEGQAGSHQKKGWEVFTDAIIRSVNQQENPIVFILWGRHAQQKALWIDTHRHCLLESAHPSPLSAKRGFFGSRPFSRANAFLEKKNRTAVNWVIPPHDPDSSG